ncbi:large conductance mechanosensitive channel protein MscL [Vagococcus silagei]|uniref:Large-conductance mechanosensitive channel n=1 Tax=Vagococcus silagei TaxID=2508885 RepID=A0A4S3B5L5_9ENTE|nr:large conductance mechanosensitive channel protein MscL [Vagococcus silagei]THB61838.1 large conductance mechanosensitive channel protein MscL [Vagococcus silagei]
MLREFKDFITKGSVIDLAVGVIVGGAFTSIVNALVSGFITPLIGVVIKATTGHKNVDDATKGLIFEAYGVEFNYGIVISALITFLITALVLFIVVKAINKAQSVIPIEPVDNPETTDEILGDIRALLQAQVKNNETILTVEKVIDDVAEATQLEPKDHS